MSFESAEFDYLEEPEGPEGYVTEERAEEMFIAGLQAMREMLARFVEADNPVIAQSMRLNWNPSWGKDPGRPDAIVREFGEL